MPIPAPRVKGKNRETQKKYVARCMKFFAGEKNDLKKEQQLAICYDTYRKARKNKSKANKSKNLAADLRVLAEHYNSNYHG